MSPDLLKKKTEPHTITDLVVKRVSYPTIFFPLLLGTQLLNQQETKDSHFISFHFLKRFKQPNPISIRIW